MKNKREHFDPHLWLAHNSTVSPTKAAKVAKAENHSSRISTAIIGEVDEHPGISPAESILTTCQRYGVALRIDADGALVIGAARRVSPRAKPALADSLAGDPGARQRHRRPDRGWLDTSRRLAVRGGIAWVLTRLVRCAPPATRRGSAEYGASLKRLRIIAAGINADIILTHFAK